MSNDLSGEQAKLIVNQAMSLFTASIQNAQTGARQKVQPLTIDLSVARNKGDALKISFPFKSLLVEQATDADAFVRLIPESNDDGIGDIRLSLKDSLNDEFGFRTVFLYWPAQSGKSMVLKFFTTSNFSSGSLVQAPVTVFPSVKVGYIDAPMDGLTFTVFGSVSHAAAVEVKTTLVKGVEDASTSFNVPFYVSDQPPGIFGGYKIPSGFNARILGCFITVITAGVTNNELFVIGVNEGQTYPTRAGLIADTSLLHGNVPLASVMASTGLDKPVLMQGVSANTFSTSRLIPSGKVVGILARNNSAVACSYSFVISLRLERIVGA